MIEHLIQKLEKCGVSTESFRNLTVPFFLLYTSKCLAITCSRYAPNLFGNSNNDLRLVADKENFQEKVEQIIADLADLYPNLQSGPQALEYIWRDSNLEGSFYKLYNALFMTSFGGPYIVNNNIFKESFQELIEFFAERSGKKAGEFSSPEAIGSLLVNILEPSSEDTIYDPVCGSGGFLTKAADYASKGMSEKKINITGQDINVATSTLAKLRLIIHGYDCANISVRDSLLNFEGKPMKFKFDMILANPPFSLKNWSNNVDLESDVFQKYGLPPKNSADFAFILHIIDCMSDVGRAGVIVPDGVLFRGGAEGEIRKNIIQENLVDAVIALPSNMFHGTNISVNIIFFKKYLQK